MTVPAPLDEVENALRRHFGQLPARASVSFVGLEPIDVLRFEPTPGELAYLSLGMSRHPMTDAAAGVLDAGGPRAELMLHVRDGAGRFADVWRRLAVLAAAPSVDGVVYRPGLTIDLGAPLAAGSRCTGAVITQAPVPPIEVGSGPAPAMQPVAVLRAVPATAAELAWARARGGAALLERWHQQATDLLDLGRAPVLLG